MPTPSEEIREIHVGIIGNGGITRRNRKRAVTIIGTDAGTDAGNGNANAGTSERDSNGSGSQSNGGNSGSIGNANPLTNLRESAGGNTNGSTRIPDVIGGNSFLNAGYGIATDGSRGSGIDGSPNPDSGNGREEGNGTDAEPARTSAGIPIIGGTGDNGLPAPHIVDVPPGIDGNAEKRGPGRPRKDGSASGSGHSTRRTSNGNTVSEDAIEAGICTLFGALEMLRGKHFHLPEDADLSLVSKPAKRMLDRLPVDKARKVSELTDPLMLIFGLFLLMQPGLTVEWEKVLQSGKLRVTSKGKPGNPGSIGTAANIPYETTPQSSNGTDYAIRPANGSFSGRNQQGYR